MLNSTELWPVFLKNARLYQEKAEIFVSPRKNKPYQIISIKRDVVKIKRLSVKENSFETISSKKFNTIIGRLDDQYPNIKKGGGYEHVVEEATIVELLPMLDWDYDEGKIFIRVLQNIDIQEGISENQSGEKYSKAVIRRGQQKLREKLLYLYSKKCAVTGCSVEAALQACHITPYVKSEICLAEDAILLRADLHSLFDSNLLAINPETFNVHIHASIQDSEYMNFNSTRIADRCDNGQLKLCGLQVRWRLFTENDGKKVSLSY